MAQYELVNTDIESCMFVVVVAAGEESVRWRSDEQRRVAGLSARQQNKGRLLHSQVPSGRHEESHGKCCPKCGINFK